MNTSANNFDSIEKIIYDDGVSIETVDIHPELDVMLIILNTKAVLRQKISSYKRLKEADKKSLLHFELIGDGTGIHWPLLDEDLSLKGFLRDELLNMVKKDTLAA
ncbi:MAG: DUF2442 domain-containing protein [Sphingobacteriales bacterium]|nr:DUF2442 domain-containing protein [Sphingobacteriales bacterium]